MVSSVRLLLHEGICQTRAVALNKHGQPFQLFSQNEFEQPLRLGEFVAGTIAKRSPADGGCFVKVSSNRQGFFAHKSANNMVEGQNHNFVVAAEARADKLARLVLATGDASPEQSSPLSRWRAMLPKGQDVKFETGPDIAREIDSVFEDAMSPICGLANGGRLQITPTPALVAIDVDSIGRQDKGRANARAKAINLDAAKVAAREIALRNLGGNIVIDCVGPLLRGDGPDIKAAFVDAFRASSTRKISCLPPSPLGMMEAIIAHGARPMHELQIGADGLETPGFQLLSGLRGLEIEAMAQTAAQLELGLPRASYGLYQAYRKNIDQSLKSRFGGRISISETQGKTAGIRKI